MSIVYNNKELSFINFKEEKIIEDTIHIDNPLSQMLKDHNGVSIYINEEDKNVCNINILDGTSLENAKASTYTFNLKTHELKKVDN